MVIKQIIRCLEDQKVESEIKEYVEGLCTKYFTEPYGSICSSFVEQYTTDILELLEQGITELDICKRFGYCSTQRISAPVSDNGFTCTICTAIVAEVEKVMVSTKVKSEVISLVEKLCNEFAAPFSTICDSIVETYVPKIMEWLEEGLDSLQICQKLKLCDEAIMPKGARNPKSI